MDQCEKEKLVAEVASHIFPVLWARTVEHNQTQPKLWAKPHELATQAVDLAFQIVEESISKVSNS